MASILCLAHYCDTHGPTPLMVTEGFPVPCSTCYEEGEPSLDRPGTGYRSLSSPGGIEDTIRRSTGTVLPSGRGIGLQQCSQIEPHRFNCLASFDTPSESPRMAALQTSRNGNGYRRDSSFRKTYDENDKKRAIPCENCALTLPKKVKEQMPDGVSGSTENNGKGGNDSPILRTRKPYERVSMALESSSPKSSSSSSSESEREPAGASRILNRTATSSSMSSFSSSNSQYHNHYLDYTSTHDPISSNSFSILRASCLRTLSCETLPPTSTTSSAPASPPGRSFPTIPMTPLASTSGGPIFFGDSLAGYTTAYIFRIPDPYARGRRRVYAFICVSPAREGAAMRAFPFLSAAFRDLATWIQTLAEAEADRMDSTSMPPPNLNPDSDGLPRSSSLLQYPSSARSPIPSPNSNSKFDSERKPSAFTPTSSFLSGRPCDLDGFPRKGLSSLRSRGLAELVGRADFFIELHARFVALLAQLATLFASTGGALGV